MSFMIVEACISNTQQVLYLQLLSGPLFINFNPTAILSHKFSLQICSIGYCNSGSVLLCMQQCSVYYLGQFIVQNKQLLRTTKLNIKYRNDPLLQPFRSYENHLLVRLLLKFSSWLSGRVSIAFYTMQLLMWQGITLCNRLPCTCTAVSFVIASLLKCPHFLLLLVLIQSHKTISPIS